ncbi:MAG: phospholipase D-like domain-containing protein [Chloroflexota bacterium]
MRRDEDEEKNGGGRVGLFAAIAAFLAALGAIFGLSLGGDEGPTLPDLTGAETRTQEETGAPPVVVPAEESILPWFDIYFTNPSCPDEEFRAGGVDEIIALDIDLAEVRVDIAAFDLDSEPMINSLIAAEERQVEVRVVVDDEHTPAATVNRLRRNGISVIEDKRSALMHNKFIVIDGRYLWTGSMNFSTNGVFCNNNNVVRIDSPRLSSNYTAEMDEMYLERIFGPRSPENTVFTFQINGSEVENYFAAEDELAPIIGRVIARADEEILFMAFSFTSDDIGEQLLERVEAGIRVRGVFESSGVTRYSYFGELEDVLDIYPNVQILKDGNPRIMHHKVFILDQKTVIFGSYNFTGNANDNNDENILIVHDPEFASYFVEEFEAVWAEAEDKG